MKKSTVPTFVTPVFYCNLHELCKVVYLLTPTIAPKNGGGGFIDPLYSPPPQQKILYETLLCGIHVQ